MIRGINPKRFLRDLDEQGDRAERQEMVKDAIAQTERELTESEALEASLTDAHAKLADHIGNEPESPAKVREENRRAVGLLIVGIILEFVIYRGALPQVPWFWSLLGSAALSAGAAALVRWQMFDHLYDAQRSKRSVRITRLAASITTWIFAGALAIWLGVRFATGAVVGLIIWLAVTSLYVAAATVILAGAMYAAAARMRAHPIAVARELRSVQKRIGTLRRFLDRLRELRDDPAGPSRAPVGSPGPKPLSGGAVAAAVVAAFIAVAACTSTARAQAPEVRCGGSTDVTRSQAPSHRREALRLFMGALPRLVEGCTIVLASYFADEGPFAPRRAVPVPQTAHARDCSTTPVTIPPQARVVASFKGARDYFRAEAVEACEREEAMRRKRYEAEDKAFRAAIMAAVDAPQLDRITGTDIVGLIESYIAAGVRRLYLLTDGAQSLPGEISSLQIPAGTRVVIFQVPLDSVYGGMGATRKVALEWREIGVEVIPYTALAMPGVLIQADTPGRPW